MMCCNIDWITTGGKAYHFKTVTDEEGISLLQLGPNMFCGMPGIIQYLRMHDLLASAMARHRHCNYKPTKHLEMGFTLKPSFISQTLLIDIRQLNSPRLTQTILPTYLRYHAPITTFIMDENMFEES